MIWELRNRVAKMVAELAGEDEMFSDYQCLRLDMYLQDRIREEEDEDKAEETQEVLRRIEKEIRQAAKELTESDIEDLLRDIVLGQSPSQAQYRRYS